MKQYLSEYKSKNILITGGAGCIGANLTKTLLEAEAAKIIVLDNLSASERWNVPNAPNVVFIQGSILDEEVLKRVFSQKLDFVFHLAAHFANQNSVDHPETNLLVNGLGTLKVLEYSYLTKAGKFVFASSGCSVYGSQASLPLKEDFVSLHLDTPYQITKLLGELYCNFFHNYYGLPVVICRYFNVYGPGEIPGRYRNVIPNFIWWALHKKPLPITGTGGETRDFTFVEDIVDGTLLAGVVPEAVDEAFNLASETETKVIDIANMVNEITGNHKEVRIVPRRDWDKITRRRASIEKATRVLGYEPETKIKEGLGKVFSAPVDVHFEETETYQPDIIFISKERLNIIKPDKIEGAPDLVIEILSPATAYHDLRKKFKVYERQGIKKYWIVDPEGKSIEIYENEGGKLKLIQEIEDKGRGRSKVLEGFELEVEEIF